MILDIRSDYNEVYISSTSIASIIWYWGIDTSGVDSMFKMNTRFNIFIRSNNMLYQIAKCV